MLCAHGGVGGAGGVVHAALKIHILLRARQNSKMFFGGARGFSRADVPVFEESALRSFQRVPITCREHWSTIHNYPPAPGSPGGNAFFADPAYGDL